MRWCFTDHTHKKSLVADILSVCEIDPAGPVYHIRLMDHSQPEPFDVGKIIVATAELKEVQVSGVVCVCEGCEGGV